MRARASVRQILRRPTNAMTQEAKFGNAVQAHGPTRGEMPHQGREPTRRDRARRRISRAHQLGRSEVCAPPGRGRWAETGEARPSAATAPVCVASPLHRVRALVCCRRCTGRTKRQRRGCVYGPFGRKRPVVAPSGQRRGGRWGEARALTPAEQTSCLAGSPRGGVRAADRRRGRRRLKPAPPPPPRSTATRPAPTSGRC
mmetsp:Transcript_77136/g.213822  ORF Transcript_77136/g.213822 Transcript_77136/m.213822 type:complete len:200 (-) Transcript_77136:678-1277(-)